MAKTKEFNGKVFYNSYELANVFGNDLTTVRSIYLDGKKYYLACDVCCLLSKCNTSYYVDNYVKTENKSQLQINEVNAYRKVIIITVDGIIDMIKRKKKVKNSYKKYDFSW